MSILLILLKIIAFILAVLLIFLLLCLFHPVFYQVQGEITEMPKPAVQGQFWWMFQILRLEFKLHEGDVSVKLRILGIGKELLKEKTKDAAEESGGEESPKEEEAGHNTKKADAAETELEQKEDTPQEDISDSVTNELEEKTNRLHIKKKREKPKKSQNKDHKTREKKKNFFSTIKREITDEKNKLAVSHIWREILYLLSHLKPKYAQGNIHFSTGDPALTGELTGVLSLFPIFYRYGLNVYPDFTADAFYVKGSLKLKGHMSLYHMVLVVIRLLGDKNIRGLIKKIRK